MDSTVRIRLSAIAELAPHRPPGYAEELIELGTIEGDYLRLARADYLTLRRKYSPLVAPRPREGGRGLGDLIHAVAHPLARAIDAVAGTNLKNCPACARRRAKLNRQFPLPG